MSKRSILITVLGVVALVAAVALGAMALSGDDPEPQSAIDPRSFTLSDDGSAVEVGVGESFSIVLEGNPTTGYSWQVESADDSVVSAAEPEYVSESDLIGAGGIFTFTFTAAGPGETQVHLVYVRPWEQVTPIQTFTLSVIVR